MKTCPTCGARVSTGPGKGAFPFCSKRCRAADLGSWLSAEHKIVDAPMHGGSEARFGDLDLNDLALADLDPGGLDLAELQRLAESNGELS